MALKSASGKPAAPLGIGEHNDGAAAADELIAGGGAVRDWILDYCQEMGDKEGKSTSWVGGCREAAHSHPAVHNLGE